jgi:hypothetical protein
LTPNERFEHDVKRAWRPGCAKAFLDEVLQEEMTEHLKAGYRELTPIWHGEREVCARVVDWFSGHAATFSSFPSISSPFLNLAPALTSATSCAPVSFLHLPSAASISL